MAAEGKYRARAAAALARLHTFYNDTTGLWDKQGPWPAPGWWNSANALDATLEFMRRTGDRTYASDIGNTFVNAQHTNAGFLNEYYDDQGWWALAWVKAYDLTRDARYLDMTKAIFANIAANGWNDDTCGGGVWWKTDKQNKNAIVNELFLTIAARLHLRTPGDGGAGSYREWVERAWSWFDASGMINDANLVNDGLTAECVNDGGATWSYNQGVILGGLVALHEATGDDTLLTRAKAIADAALHTDVLVDEKGILREPERDTRNLHETGAQFKGIFVRNLTVLYEATGEQSYRDAILRNADAIWSRSRDASGALGIDWAGPFDLASAARQSSALDALNGALLFDTTGTTYQAENGVLHNLSTEAKYSGFHGSGYVAGWNHDGQAVDIAVTVASDGLYDLAVRYAAIDDAVRCMHVGGTVAVPMLPFARTGSWTAWATSTAYDVRLRAGRNVVTIAFEHAHGSKGYLNVDEVTVL
jgi:predicted alpha-1,6-mannanase (GH76 family)